jgi:hypothetical protein
MQGKRVAGEDGFAISQATKLAPCVKRRFAKAADRIGALHGLDAGEKINSKPVKQTRGQDSHENMGHCRRRADRPVLSQLSGATPQYG